MHMATANEYPKKEYTVVKAVKVGGDEYLAGATVKLTQPQADRLLGLFVEEYVKPQGDDAKVVKGKVKAGDGL
jgi:hypothetical protein